MSAALTRRVRTPADSRPSRAAVLLLAQQALDRRGREDPCADDGTRDDERDRSQDGEVLVAARTHTEIFHLVRLADRMVGELPDEGPATEDLNDLRRVLYGLDAILRSQMAQEEELYMALGDEHPTASMAVTASA